MSWIYYLLEANFYLALFYAAYYLLLRRDTYYQLNRAYLLVSSLLAFVIPVLQLGFLRPVTVMAEQVTQVNFAAYSPPINNLVNHTIVSVPVVTINYYLLAYIGITILMAISFSLRVFQLSRLASKGRQKADKKFHLIEMDEEGRAFSFFSYLFISKKFTASDTIIQHELVHIRQKHSLDIMYVELLKIICWFNPAVYLLQNSIRELHEYIADSQVASAQNNVNEYTDFLVNNAYGLSEPLLTNSFFNKNLLKNRIMMLHQKKSGALARLKLLITLPLLAGMLCLSTLGFTKDYHVIDLLPANTSDNIKKAQPHIPVFPSTPVQPKKFLMTKKGYRYAESVWNVKGKNYFRVSIIGDDSVQNDYFTNTVTAAQIKLLRNKYGYAFPKKEVLDKLTSVNPVTPANNNVADSAPATKNSESTTSNDIVYVINPSTYTYSKLADIATKLYDKGYVMNYTETNKGTADAQLTISLETTPEIKWHEKTSATFRVSEMIQEKYLIKLGVDMDNKHFFVHSMPADSIFLKNIGFSTMVSKTKINGVESFSEVIKNNDTTNSTIYIEFYRQIANHLKYTKDSRTNNIQGKVFVMFNVDDDRKITNINILRGLTDEQNAEVLKTIRTVTVPDNMKTGINYTIPISFTLTDPATGKYMNGKTYINPHPAVSEYKRTGYKTIDLSEIVIMGVAIVN